eukprot:CAMPEP_0185744826 /NCGR_PEP_ID=MMETSP1174-20130828/3040_1 /TAXON_ID=35687 /ORGANISM="Dictyocha speculum, Strain CCMP1381" /LENGTH=45 /DNA_ID= /DNA_START= /DNA_END= /DNA_ORIENTATION=
MSATARMSASRAPRTSSGVDTNTAHFCGGLCNLRAAPRYDCEGRK